MYPEPTLPIVAMTENIRIMQLTLSATEIEYDAKSTLPIAVAFHRKQQAGLSVVDFLQPTLN